MTVRSPSAAPSVGPPPGRPAQWWGRRTLLWRLVAGLIALLVLTCAVIGVSTTLALRGFLVDRVDAQLPQLVGVTADELSRTGTDGAGGLSGSGGAGSFAPRSPGGGPGGGDGMRGPGDGRTTTLAVRVSAGAVTSATLLVPGTGLQTTARTLELAAADAAELAALGAGSAPATVSLAGAGDFRVQAFGAGDGVSLVVGLPTRELDATTTRLVTIELVVFAAAVVLAGLAGLVAVRLALRPLQRVAATAGAVALTPMGSGEVVLPAGVVDVDERTEVGQVGVAFNLMLARVGSALEERHATEERLRRFVADASHELRTPLAAIRGHSELAGRRADEIPPDVAHGLARVHSESLRMGGLVDDLLLLARLDAGRPLAREEVDLTRLVLDATSDARAADLPHDAGGAHRWRLELPEDVVTVVGDTGRLHQVLANLLANARTHTPAGTTVTVRLEAPRAGRVALSVTDDGPGIAPAVVGRVFERFVRADAARTRADAGANAETGAGAGADAGASDHRRPGGAGSSGLGLAIVEAVVTAHHGSVGVESAPGRTCFLVELPAA